MLKIAIYMDNLNLLEFSHDTTIFLIRSGLMQGYHISIFYENDVFVKENLVYAYLKDVKLSDNAIEIFNNHTEILSSYDVLLIRKDPPVNLKYITTTSILSLIESELITINSPKSILLFSEKIWPTVFKIPQPETLISSNIAEIISFKNKYNDIVLKPLYNFCGNGIYVSIGKDLNFLSIVESLLNNTNELPIIAQKYLSNVKNGDRRVILIGGKAVGAINRIADKKDHRCNMKVGGTPTLHKLSPKEIELCNEIGNKLLKYNLHFVGIDIIDDCVTEINTTTPTGLVQIKELGGGDLSTVFWNYIEKLLI